MITFLNVFPDGTKLIHNAIKYDPLLSISASFTYQCYPLLQRPTEGQEDEHFTSGWRGLLSSIGLSIPASLCRLAPPALRLGQRRMLQGKTAEIPEHVLRLAGVGPDKLRAEWSLPGFITMFLPEFPHRSVPGHEHFQVDINSNIDTNNIVRFDVVEKYTTWVFHSTRFWVTSPKVPLDPF